MPRKPKIKIGPEVGPPDKRAGSMYSDRDKAIALATLDYFNGNYTEAAAWLRQMKWRTMNKTTLANWHQGHQGVTAHVQELRKGAVERIAEQVDFAMETALRRLIHELPKMQHRELIGAVSVLGQRQQLLKQLTGEKPEHPHQLVMNQFVQLLGLPMPATGDGSISHIAEPEEAREIVIQPSDGGRVSGRKNGGPANSRSNGTPAKRSTTRRKQGG